MAKQSATRPAGEAAAAAAEPGAGKLGAHQTFPVNNKIHNAPRPAYRLRQPPPPRKHRRRGFFCQCCIWTTLLILLILFLAAITAAVVFFLYRPQRPSVTVNSLHICGFNLTDTAITSAFNFSVTAHNPNNRIAFIYDQIWLQVVSSSVVLANRSFPGFMHGENNVTVLQVEMSKSNATIPNGTDLTALKSSLTRKLVPLEIVLDTKVQVRIGRITTKKLQIRFICDAAGVPLPNTMPAPVATISGIQCKVKPLIKIVNWTLL